MNWSIVWNSSAAFLLLPSSAMVRVLLHFIQSFWPQNMPLLKLVGGAIHGFDPRDEPQAL